jgi:DNA-binding NtrC family response regulator
MAWRLNVVRGARPQRFLLPMGSVVLGSAEDCDLVLLDPTVSRRHLRLSVDADGVEVEDLGSRNGAAVDGRRLQDRQRLHEHARLRIGDIELQLSAVSSADAEAVTAAVAGSATPVMLGPPEATLGLAPLTGFCRDDLPALLAALAHQDGASFPARLVDALCRQQGVQAVQIQALDGALVAQAGDPALPANIEHASAQWRLLISASSVDLQPALGRMAQIGLDLLQLVRRPAETRARAGLARASTANAERARPPDPPTGHAGLAKLYAQAARVASGDLNVLIEGESGTGKELFARFLHEASGSEVALVCLNCAALPRDLLDAELFGIEAGVATGVSARPGCFERAHGGTLFLDEIADMAPDTQARLLRVLQEKRVFRIGGRESRPAQVRIVSASNRSLQEQVRRGDFRLDLYHRVQDWCVTLPPLRERREDIINLASYFLTRECGKRQIGSAGISRAAADALQSYAWPGNVRELEREMRRIALFLDDGELVGSDLLKTEIRAGVRDPGAPGNDSTLAAQLAAAERAIIERSLRENGGNVVQAADALGVGKSTLYRRIAELEIGRE